MLHKFSVCALLLASVLASAAQVQVSTVKLSTGAGGTSVSMAPHELIFRNATVRYMVQMAYRVRDFQIAGGPAWIDSDRYNVTIKMDNWTRETREQMIAPALQTLLKDRFKLSIHRVMNDLPIYSLTVSKYGLRLPRSKATCTKFDWGRDAVQRSPEHCGGIEAGPNLRLNHTLDAAGMSISGPNGLIVVLSRELNRDVIDKTGLTGFFDIHLEWNREITARSIGSDGRVDPSRLAASTDDESPSIFMAVEDQLGLRLDSSKGPVEVIVVDRAEKPSEN
jgi:uncharacterized protein (TIGR03435 family)